MIEAFFLTLAGRLVQERFRKAVAYALLGVAVILVVGTLLSAGRWAWNTWLDNERANAVQAEQVKQQVATADARGRSAEERADDAIHEMIASQTREEEIAKAAASEQAKQPKQRATLPPTTIALNCQRLRQAYSSAELAKMSEYQRVCAPMARTM
ncbi:hypothetical protein [Novosphingobium gossypii]|uniref:hypothetical protein n=1 Tax=Novosphingobium gossypii TaxID=1604774 RepID=UPI003D1B0F1F